MISKLAKYIKDPHMRADLWILFRYFNIWKTISLNLRMLPIGQAIKLPIIIFGKSSFLALTGKIVIESLVISAGMIKLGFPLDIYFNPTLRGLLKINGNLIFRGESTICCGYNFNIAQNGQISIGNNVKIGANVNMSGVRKITIGDNSRIAFETVFMSSSFHYVLDKSTGIVTNVEDDIDIGCYNWIGNRTTVYKGVRTPTNCITTSGSILNKNYLNIPEYSLIGGSPAKQIKENVTRVWNGKSEMKLHQIFRETRETSVSIENLPIK